MLKCELNSLCVGNQLRWCATAKIDSEIKLMVFEHWLYASSPVHVASVYVDFFV